MTKPKGVRNGPCGSIAFTADQVAEIVRMRDGGKSFYQLSFIFDRSRQVITNAYYKAKGKTPKSGFKGRKSRDQWPLLKDPMAVKVQFEDVDAMTLAREARRNPGIIYAGRTFNNVESLTTSAAAMCVG